MKKFTLLYLLLLLISYNTLAQKENKNNFGLGVFVGEGTGILANYSLNDKFKIEWNIAYHEIFYNYLYIKKYPDFRYRNYTDIYSSSILLSYRNNFFGINKLNYRFTIGGQIRLITDFSEGIPVSMPPNTIIIIEPTLKNKIDFGISPLIGVEYEINKKFSTFLDFGAYIEIIDTFLWTNFQFRTGLMYHINCKINK
ncbi:MAG TPA: hypothetical protein PLW77_06365 [Bacteroidales bacterium]|nr:hypothetical protein [Bacteroidales bacterium]HQB21912.1 hypothetical protein [Bacteroidales bacterium]